MHHGQINIGHFLIALVIEDGSIPQQVMVMTGLSVDAIREEVRQLPRSMTGDANDMALAEDVKQVLRLTVEEAYLRQIDKIGPEHLLLGLTRFQIREWEYLFEALGLDPNGIRKATLLLMGEPTEDDNLEIELKRHPYGPTKMTHQKEAIDMTKRLIVIGGIVMALGVALGAFGAHGLEATLEANGRLDTFHTGTYYHLVHGLAIFIAAWLSTVYDDRKIGWAGYLFLAGVIFFSGSLYILSIFDIGIMGAVAPIGGAAFIVGWLMIAWVAWKAE